MHGFVFLFKVESSDKNISDFAKQASAQNYPSSYHCSVKVSYLIIFSGALI